MRLDFNLIHQMYPSAFEEYLTWINAKVAQNGSSIYFHDSYLFYDKGTMTNAFINNTRDLYDFFDDNDITIEVYKEQVLGAKVHQERWCFDVGICISKGYPNRRLAELSAFKQGFRELEKKM